MRMRGQGGSWGVVHFLDGAPHSNFKEGRHDVFALRDVPIDELRDIEIGHDQHGYEFAWLCDRVRITPEGKEPVEFPSGDWFSSEQGNVTRRVLQAATPESLVRSIMRKDDPWGALAVAPFGERRKRLMKRDSARPQTSAECLLFCELRRARQPHLSI